ncbi:mRNA 3' end processing factor [Diaporthe australafricana]|uniref:mRNA 3' end processing factor n=1 Tax=Diaporthe australafricana TaxID=127596 RepID=A0ABR3WH76_9PEZI
MSYDEQDQTAEVIEDYQSALDGLTMNSRFEITNLTQIARDLTNYAFPIAETLEQHIKKVPPQRKLPAMYVLDSIVKNIGTPYTLFFGKNLYSTFMDSYASVNDGTRKKMEEMLKTWKEPVPGSIDKNPVFSPDVVRPIENALIKARTSALQAHQEQMRTQHQLFGRGGRPVAAPHRNTPTPPNARQQFNQPQPPQIGINGHRPESAMGQPAYPQLPPAHYHQGSTPQPLMSTPAAAPFQPPPFGSYGAPAAQPGISIDSLINEIEQLIVGARAELGRSPFDASIQAELKALVDLQTVLKTRGAMLSQEQLVPVKTQVANLAVKYRASNAQQTVTPTPPIHGPPFHAPIQHQPHQIAPVAPAPPASAPPAAVSLDALLGKGALAALLSRRSATPQVPTPQQQPATVAALRSPPSQKAELRKPTTPDPMALLGALRGFGLIPPTTQSGGTPVSKPLAPPPHPAAAAHEASLTTPTPTPGGTPLPPNLASILAAARNLAASSVPPPVIITSGDISLTTSSLKQFRPHLVPTIYEALGPPCTQCGRRFKTDEEGRKKKTAHMDWHFRVHQRIVEAEKRGQHRSWYVDQADWIKSRETIDDHQADADADAAKNAAASSTSKSSGPKIKYIPVPEDGDNTNTVCPICQEKFVTKWLDEAQEWVWTDAMRVGGRAFHASCYTDVSKDGGNMPMYGGGGVKATPDPVLGKRKAEGEMGNHRGGRFKMDA